MTWTPNKNEEAMIAAACGQLNDAVRETFKAKVASRLQAEKNVTKNHVRAAITATLNEGK